MTTAEAQNAWGYSTDLIREFCQYGFIPGARKKVFWSLPNDAEKPPVSVNAFIVLMESIAEFREGGNPNVYRKGLPKEKIKDALYYLSGFGFIAGYDNLLEYPECVKHASLLNKSYEIIKKYRGKNNIPPSVEIKGGMRFGGDIGNLYAEIKTSY